MSVTQVDLIASASADAAQREPTATIGLLSPRAFLAAAATIPDLAAYADYDDWLDARDGVRMGLALGGVDAEFAPVSLTALLAWARVTGNALGEASLDRLAAFVRAARGAPKVAALAEMDRRDFEALAARLAPTGGARDFATWLRRRDDRRAELAASGARVFELPVRFDDLVAWCDCLGLPVSETAPDAYAGLLLELLATD